MSGVSITGLNPASTLTGSEIVPIVQSGTTAKTTLNAMPYVPAGTGAVTTTIQSKLRETVSVKDFGAVGDGSDATTAFTNALATGKAIYVPAGTYLLNFVNVPSNTMLFGDGANTIIKPSTADIRCALGADSGSSSTYIENVTIKDIKFLGDVVASGFNEQKHLTSFNGVKNLLIENCQFVGFRGDGIYIGSGNNGGEERHNINVTVRSCFFDGITKENRNGISVIDGNGVLIEGNYFTRTTKSTMPGAIDIEPDAAVFHVVKDIKILDNKFYDIGGNVGAISIPLPGVTYTTAPTGFLVQGNFVDTCSSFGVLFQYNVTGGVTEATANFAVKIVKNTIVNSNRPVGIFNGKDVLIDGNSFLASAQASLLSYNTANDNLLDCKVTDNLFYNCGNVGGTGLEVFTCSRVSLAGNTFKDCGTGLAGLANAIDFNTGTSSYISFTDNIFISPASKTLVAIQVEGSHTLTPLTNTFLNNLYGSLSCVFTATNNDSNETAYTPVVTGASTAGTGTYTVQYGRWRQIGKIVFFRVKVSVNSGHTGTGMIQVGLPTVPVVAPNNEETTVALVASGVATTGGHIGLINPALIVSGNGAVRCYYNATGTLSQMTIPAGAFTVNMSGFYQTS